MNHSCIDDVTGEGEVTRNSSRDKEFPRSGLLAFVSLKNLY